MVLDATRGNAETISNRMSIFADCFIIAAQEADELLPIVVPCFSFLSQDLQNVEAFLQYLNYTVSTVYHRCRILQAFAICVAKIVQRTWN